MEPFANKVSLALLNGTINKPFGLKDPLWTKKILIQTGRNEGPCIVSEDGFKLASHGSLPGKELGHLCVRSWFLGKGGGHSERGTVFRWWPWNGTILAMKGMKNLGFGPGNHGMNIGARGKGGRWRNRVERRVRVWGSRRRRGSIKRLKRCWSLGRVVSVGLMGLSVGIERMGEGVNVGRRWGNVGWARLGSYMASRIMRGLEQYKIQRRDSVSGSCRLGWGK